MKAKNKSFLDLTATKLEIRDESGALINRFKNIKLKDLKKYIEEKFY